MAAATGSPASRSVVTTYSIARERRRQSPLWAGPKKSVQLPSSSGTASSPWSQSREEVFASVTGCSRSPLRRRIAPERSPIQSSGASAEPAQTTRTTLRGGPSRRGAPVARTSQAPESLATTAASSPSCGQARTSSKTVPPGPTGIAQAGVAPAAPRRRQTPPRSEATQSMSPPPAGVTASIGSVVGKPAVARGTGRRAAASNARRRASPPATTIGAAPGRGRQAARRQRRPSGASTTRAQARPSWRKSPRVVAAHISAPTGRRCRTSSEPYGAGSGMATNCRPFHRRGPAPVATQVVPSGARVVP